VLGALNVMVENGLGVVLKIARLQGSFMISVSEANKDVDP
jgi:hypothetical protein